MKGVYMRNKIILTAFVMSCTWLGSLQAATTSKEQLLYQQVDTVVRNYQLAHLQYEDGDDSKALVMSKSLEDLEDLANQCFKLKKCSKSKIFSAYEQLIKRNDIEDLGSINPSATPFNMPALNSTVKLLSGQNLELLIRYNEPMQAAISTWLSTQRGFFMDSWVNYQYMRYLMAPEYEKAGLPEALLFGMMTKESGGKVHSVSKAGAAGPLQFMPGTGTRFGLGYSNGADMRYDPQFATRANAAYMNERFEELNKSLEMAIAGYNGGEGRARRIHNEFGGASFWNQNVYNEWPAETRDYVPAVIAAAWLFMHGKDYGLTFPKIDATPSEFRLSRSASISELTICLGNPDNMDSWYRVLRNLNPAYEPSQYLGQGTLLRAPKKLVQSYQAHCVSGPRADLAKTLIQSRKVPAYASLPYEPRVALIPNQVAPLDEPVKKPKKEIATHKVKKGETLMSIARKFDCLVPELVEANNLKAPSFAIFPKQEIKLAGCKK
jgi:membrane-bound lytic murein transglycosylase D